MSFNKQVPSFFILGLPRAGTSLLEQMLDQHSKISVCPEIASGLIVWRLNVSKWIWDKWQHILLLNYLYHRASNFKTKMTEVLLNQAKTEFRFPIETQFWFRSLKADFIKEKKAEIYGEKTPENILYVRELEQANPDCKFIVVERHPMDVIYSICDNAKSFHGYVHSPKKYFNSITPVIKRYLNAIIYHKTMGRKQFFFIKYEELVQNPISVLERICHFLEVEFEPAMLNYMNKKAFSEKGSDMKKIHSMLDKPITTERINRSFKFMEEDELHFVNRYLSKELQLLTYPAALINKPISLQFECRVLIAKLKYLLKLDLVEDRIIKCKILLRYIGLKYLKWATIQDMLLRGFTLK